MLFSGNVWLYTDFPSYNDFELIGLGLRVATLTSSITFIIDPAPIKMLHSELLVVETSRYKFERRNISTYMIKGAQNLSGNGSIDMALVLILKYVHSTQRDIQCNEVSIG